jgi:hypothetical protein
MNRFTTLALLAILTLAASALAGCSARSSSSDAAEAPPTIVSTPVLEYGGFAGPERVLYDADRDRYLVSNVNGDPTGLDGNGFISVLSPTGEVVAAPWIAGGVGGAVLDAPKGLAIAGGILYVADISTVRLFDAETGAPAGEIAIPGSTYLNGVSADSSGRVFVTDSGPPQGTLDASGTQAVYRIENGAATTLAGGSLGRPTSIAASSRGVVIAPFGAASLYRLDERGQKRDVTKLPAQGLAGVVELGDWLFVSSWTASAVLRGKLGGSFEVALPEQSSPTDLGFDTTRSRLLVPHYTDDRVDVFDVH